MSGGQDRVMLSISFAGIEKKLNIKRLIPIGDLKLFKKQFLKMNQMNAFSNLDDASLSFIDYI